MAAKFKVKNACSGCGGTGTMPLPNNSSMACPMCGGTGEVEVAWIKLKEIEDKLDEILAKLNEV